jgi:transposase
MHNKYTSYFLYSALTNKYLFCTIRGMRYTKKQFEAEYPDDDACLEAVFQNRFGDLNFCPSCAAETTFYRVKKRQCYACQWCGYQLHPLADTIFRKTTTPLKDWFYAIYLFSVSKNGISAKELERHLGVTYKTAWRMCKQIRLLMEQEAVALAGDIEIDETYIGGKHKRSAGYSKKSAVFGMVERNGSAKATHVRSSGARILLKELEKGVTPAANIYSDEYRAYKSLSKRGYSHTTVNHSKLEYARGSAHTNTIEGFWSQLKRSIDGTYHAVSPKYLQSYVDEFVFHYNFRDVAVCPVLLELAAKPV